MRMMIYPYYQQQKIVHCPMSVDFSNVKIAYKFGEITPNGGTEYVHITNNRFAIFEQCVIISHRR